MGNRLPVELPGEQYDQMSSPEVAELQREKQLFEVNKFAGRELSALPKFDYNHDSLDGKSADELLEYARQNTLQNSLRLNSKQNGLEVPDLNFGENSQLESSRGRTEMGMSRSYDFPPKDTINQFSDISSQIGFRGTSNAEDSGSSFHRPVYNIAELLRKVLRGNGQNYPDSRGKVPYDDNPMKFLYDYLLKGGNERKQLPPGSLAAVSIDGASPLQMVPSISRKFESRRYSNEPNFFSRQNFFHRGDIPHPGENITSNNTIKNHSISKQEGKSNLTENNITDLIDDPIRLFKTKTFHHDPNITQNISKSINESTSLNKNSLSNMTLKQKSMSPEYNKASMVLANISNIQFDKIQKGLDEVMIQVKNMFHSKKNKNTSSPLNKAYKRAYKTIPLLKFFLLLSSQAAQAKRSYIIAKSKLETIKRWQKNHQPNVYIRDLNKTMPFHYRSKQYLTKSKPNTILDGKRKMVNKTNMVSLK